MNKHFKYLQENLEIMNKLPHLAILSSYVGISAIIIYYFWYMVPYKSILLTDYPPYYVGAKSIKEGMAAYLYSPEAHYYFQGKFIGEEASNAIYRNLPITALIYLPFTFLLFYTSYKLFVLASVLVSYIFTAISVQTFANIRKHPYFFLIPLFFLPSVAAIGMGQYSWIYALLLLVIYKLLPKSTLFTGLLSSLVILKPQLIILIPFIFILAKSNINFLKGLIVGIGIITAINFLLVGSLMFSYPKFALETETSQYGAKTEEILSLHAGLKTATGLQNNYSAMVNAFVYLVILSIFYVKRRYLDYSLLFAKAVLFSLVLSVHVMGYDLTLLLIPILILLDYSLKANPFRKLPAILSAVLFFTPLLLMTGVSHYYIPLIIFITGLFIVPLNYLYE
jgi:hypothetical protein